MTPRTALRLLTLLLPLLAFRAVAEPEAKPAEQPVAQQAKPAAKAKRPPGKPEKKGSALTACTERADRIFVTRCQQACQVDAKGDTAKANKCVDECGKQPQRQQTIKDCMTQAGYP